MFQLTDGGTVPPEVFVAAKKSDGVMIEKRGEIEVFGLTNSADKLDKIANAQSRKYERYKILNSAIPHLQLFLQTVLF